MMYLTAFHAIEEHIRSGKDSGALLVSKAGPRAKELVSLATTHRIRIERTGADTLNRLAPDHRGIALQVESDFSAGVNSLEEFTASLTEERTKALIVILDEITDPHNYGAILRSCDQFGVDLVLTRNRRSAKYTEVVASVSAGAASWVPVVEVANLPRAIVDLKDAGFWIYGADMTGKAVYTVDLIGRIALVLGSESDGISRLVQENCDGLIAIPSRGKIDSLNVSVAAGVLLYEIMRQNNPIKG
jgi:23S rRNA (guanosine2251-2'-O)-methyltransferase